ncbi:MAG: protein-disulfide reductase DsbD domain-containing protein, partial [Thermoanaerobaculia bacterium]
GHGVVTADLALQPPDTDGWCPFILRLRVAPGWHLYAHDQDSPHTRPTLVMGRGVELGRVEYPPGEDLTLAEGGETVRGYQGEIAIHGALRSAGDQEGVLVVEYQACDDRRCLAPAEIALSLSHL